MLSSEWSFYFRTESDLFEGALLDLELLVQQRQLVVAADELRAQNVSLVDNLPPR